MIFIIDGGSLLNLQSELFGKGPNIVTVVRAFFDRFNDALVAKGASAFFVLKGDSPGTPVSRRAKYGVFTLIFAQGPGQEEEQLFECANSVLNSRSSKGGPVLVTDNRNRAIRAGFMEVRTLRTDEFKRWLLDAEAAASNSEPDDSMTFGEIEYWSDVFGLDPDTSFELGTHDDGPAEEKDGTGNGNKGQQ